MDLRCSVASAQDGEALAGTAPTDVTWLLVEQAGDWAPKVPLARADARVQLIRRHGGGSGPGVRVFWVDLGAGTLGTTVVRDAAEAVLVQPPDLTPYDGPLWLVCTHGRRDVCCAERGRPVAAALAERWPQETWETTHLGGHRFAATLLAVPSGIALGRLTPRSAVAACESLRQGRLELDVVRGRAGTPAIAQVAEHHLRVRDALRGLDDVRVVALDGDRVTLSTPGGTETVRLRAQETPRRQSCGEDGVKPATAYRLG
ncbi:MAG: sucrase ferredoxin [Nocardioides sp.]|nr:sucrase ferredoxin [Nocardioides sp.]